MRVFTLGKLGEIPSKQNHLQHTCNVIATNTIFYLFLLAVLLVRGEYIPSPLCH